MAFSGRTQSQTSSPATKRLSGSARNSVFICPSGAQIVSCSDERRIRQRIAKSFWMAERQAFSARNATPVTSAFAQGQVVPHCGISAYPPVTQRAVPTFSKPASNAALRVSGVWYQRCVSITGSAVPSRITQTRWHRRRVSSRSCVT